MSRIGNKATEVPQGTEVKISEESVVVKGPKGELTLNYRPENVKIVLEDNLVKVTPVKDDIESNALWGTYSSHIQNMVQGVNEEFEKKLVVEGVGFRSEVKGDSLSMMLGFSHPVDMKIPEGLTVTAENNEITIKGPNKETVGQFAANIRSKKKPEPYKGKGIRYIDEVIRRKEGKKAL